MRCFKCETRLEPLLIDDPPVDVGLIDGGGTVRFEFGYGSRHDCDTGLGFVCDNCFDKLRALLAADTRATAGV